MYRPISDHNPIPAPLGVKLAASASIARGRFVTINSAGYGAENDGTVPNVLCAGLGDSSLEQTVASSVAGAASGVASQRFCYGLVSSTVANDGFTIADWGVPFYIAAAETPGKLSHTGADGTLVNRSLGGLVFGLDELGEGTPVLFPGPIAVSIARGVAHANASVVASDKFTLTANTTRAETLLVRRNACHGRVVQVRIVSDNGFTQHDTQYWTISVYKRTSTTPGTAVKIAESNLKTVAQGGIGTLTAFAYANLALVGGIADDLLEDDAITVVCTSAGTSAGITNLTVEVIQKVQ
jgi:hypothetical protein